MYSALPEGGVADYTSGSHSFYGLLITITDVKRGQGALRQPLALRDAQQVKVLDRAQCGADGRRVT